MTRSVGRGTSCTRTMAELAAAYLADLALRSKPATVRAARSALDIARREMGDALPDVAALEAWRNARSAQGRANRTINRDMTTLGAMFRFAHAREWISENPVKRIKKLPQKGRWRRRIGRAASDDEVRRLVDAATSIDARYPKRFPRAPLLRALFETGCRWGELVAATWADIDTDALTLLLRFTKTDTDRVVELSPGLLCSMLALRHAHVRVNGELPRGSDRIYLSPTGKPWAHGTTNYLRFLSDAMRLARIPKADTAGRVLPYSRRAKVVHHQVRAKQNARASGRRTRRD